jgi:hypothetical protein
MSSVPTLAVVLLTKDEHDLIEDFLAYHGALFGRENVVVVDNGSTDARVLEAYDRHRSLGGSVVVEPRPFREAAAFMSEHMMRMIRMCPHYEFILPLETDEFVFVREKEGIRGIQGIQEIRQAVHEAIRRVPENVGVVRYGAFWCSCVDPSDAGYARGAYSRPAAQITRFRDQGWDKLIVRCRAFAGMRQWCHHADLLPGYFDSIGLVPGDLGLLHFHEAGVRRRVERALPVAVSYGYVDPGATLSERLASLRPVRGAPVACGHKAEQVLDHLERQAALEAFRTYLGRLPGSPEELSRYATHEGAESPGAAVRRDLARGQLRRATNQDQQPQAQSVSRWDDLLYHEVRTEHAFVVRQVAEALAELDADKELDNKGLDNKELDAERGIDKETKTTTTPTTWRSFLADLVCSLSRPIVVALVLPSSHANEDDRRLADEVSLALPPPHQLFVFDRRAPALASDSRRILRVDAGSPDVPRLLGRSSLDAVVDASANESGKALVVGRYFACRASKKQEGSAL